MTLTRILIILAAAAGTAAAADPWPVDLETRYLTSNFMEHRPGRFHTGLDFKTRGETGFPVRAVEDGWISRIRFSPRGYGKVVYLRGRSGRTYVYAHLERLRDSFSRLVRDAQRRRGRWDVDLHFPASRHVVAAGEVLALSGQSGTNGPHLHFEVRDAKNRPLDPQAVGFAVPDTLPPVITRLRVTPTTPASRVDGDEVSRVCGDGDAALPPVVGDVRVRGPVLLSARIVEYSDVRRHKLAPWRLRVTCDDSLVFESRNERLEFGRNDRSRLEWLATPLGRERMLMVQEGDDLEGRTGRRWSFDPGVLTPGPHRIRLEAEDRAGNTAAVSWTLRVADRDAPPATPSLAWRAAPLRTELPGAPSGVAWLGPYLASVDGGIVDADGLARALGGDLPALVRPDTVTGDDRRRARDEQGLTALGPALRIDAGRWPDGAVHRWRLVSDVAVDSATACYRRGSNGRWRLAAAVVRRDGGWLVELRGAGRYALFADRRPPALTGPRDGWTAGPSSPVPHAGFTAPRWEAVDVGVHDDGSGVDWSSLRAAWDGVVVHPEPDPPRKRVLVRPPATAAPGDHVLTLSIRDAAGRLRELRETVRLSAP